MVLDESALKTYLFQSEKSANAFAGLPHGECGGSSAMGGGLIILPREECLLASRGQ